MDKNTKEVWKVVMPDYQIEKIEVSKDIKADNKHLYFSSEQKAIDRVLELIEKMLEYIKSELEFFKGEIDKIFKRREEITIKKGDK